MTGVKREIWRIAVPSIIANVTIPLLGLVDTAIAGHIGEAQTIGAIAVGTMIFNIIYWGFGFLRMGTSGLTAQATGAGDENEISSLLQHSLGLAVIIAAGLLVLQRPICDLALWVIGPSEGVAHLARRYFYIVIWGALPTLLMMSVKGWLLGRQDSLHPMLISVGVNVLNIAASVVAVFGLDMGFVGVAVGTCLAQWLGLAYSAWIMLRHHRRELRLVSISGMLSLKGAHRFLSVNNHIFWRTAIMMAVTTYFIAAGARSGDVILAVNSLIMQLFTLFSYFMDGVANAGEAVMGKYYGMRNRAGMALCLRGLLLWAGVITLLFTAVYALFPHEIFSMLTNSATVVSTAMDYRNWCLLIPACGALAFVWDGVYIGVGRTADMLLTVLVAGLAFFAFNAALPTTWGNNRLWTAFITYLVVRSVIQSILWIKTKKKWL